MFLDKNIVLTVPYTLIIISINVKLNNLFINSRSLLYLIFLPFNISLVKTTQLVSYKIIGSTVRFVNKLFHFNSVRGVLWNCYIWVMGV